MIGERTTWMAAVAVLVVAWSAMASSCGAEAGPGPGSGPSASGADTAEENGSVGAHSTDPVPSSGTGLTGTVVAGSDVAGTPPQTLGPASLLVVPAALTEEFWTSQGFEASGADAPVDFALDPATLPAQVQVVGVDHEGRFRTEVGGAVLLCLADLYGETDPPTPPRYVQGGCVRSPAEAAEVVLQSEGSTSLTVVARR